MTMLMPSYDYCFPITATTATLPHQRQKTNKHTIIFNQIAVQTQHDGRFYQLHIKCPEKYPAVPPEVRFVSRINMNCVDSRTGAVQASKLSAMRNWNRNMGIEQVLQAIRVEMCTDQNRRLRQPAEGTTF